MAKKPTNNSEQIENTVIDLGTVDTRSGESSTTKSK